MNCKFLYLKPSRVILEKIWPFWVAFFLSIGFLIGLTCCGDVRRKSPHNMILLSGFTIAEGIMLGLATSTYTKGEVLLGIIQKFRTKSKIGCLANSITYLKEYLKSFKYCVIFESYTSFFSCWNMCDCCFGPYHFCVSNQVWFYNVQWNSFRTPFMPHDFWNLLCHFPG